MIRLNVTTEGITEKGFVDVILGVHLRARGIAPVAYCITTSFDRRIGKIYKGGLSSYVQVKKDMLRRFREYKSPDDRFTTMFDLYGLPQDFPGMQEVRNVQNPYEKVRILEQALADDFQEKRLIPYIQLHEFEALLLAAPDKLLTAYPDDKEPVEKLIHTISEENPELIDGGINTAPSKRIIKYLPDYDKVNAGLITAMAIGLSAIRKRCRHFDEWISRLENLK